MKGMVTLDYQNLAITASREAWFNATEIAAIFGKKPYEWLRLPETERYIQALIKREKEKAAESEEGKSRITKAHFIKTQKGNTKTFQQGTWLHPKLTVAFARWLNIDFAIWCDEQIMQLLTEAPQWQQERREVAICTQLQNEALKTALEAQGKTPKPYHYINEARLINHAITGKYGALAREHLNGEQLKTLRTLTIQNMMGILRGQPYQVRKQGILNRLEAIA